MHAVNVPLNYALGLTLSSLSLPPEEHPERMYQLILLLMFVAGVYLFFRGFRIYWIFRVLRNLPVSTIRSLAMGLVRVRGRATGSETLTSPLTSQPCYYYSLRIAKWETDSRNNSYWRRYWRDTDQVRFYLEDETGKVLLNPRGAELQLNKTFQEIIDGELPESLFASPRREGVPDSKSVADAVSAGQAASERYQLELIGALAKGRAPSETGRFRLTEYCITPGIWYEVTGTCTPNPLATNGADSNQIKRGNGKSLFLITDKESLEQTLDLRAIASILGGAFLSLLSAALMLLFSRMS